MTQDDAIGYGVNVLDEFYSAWPYSTGVDLNGFKSYYSTQDLASIGAVSGTIQQDSANKAIQIMAQTWPQSEPTVQDFQNVLMAIGANDSFLSAVESTFLSGVQSAAGITQTGLQQAGQIETAAVAGTTSVLGSLKTVLWVAAIGAIAIAGVVYYPEVKKAIQMAKAKAKELGQA